MWTERKSDKTVMDAVRAANNAKSHIKRCAACQSAFVASLDSAITAQSAAAPEAAVKDAIPEGWVFHSADFSMQSCGAQDYGRVALIRDQNGRKWWHSLSDEARESTELFYYGKGKTVALAIQNAVAAILSAADSRSPDKCQCNAEGEVTDACKDCPR